MFYKTEFGNDMINVSLDKIQDNNMRLFHLLCFAFLIITLFFSFRHILYVYHVICNIMCLLCFLFDQHTVYY